MNKSCATCGKQLQPDQAFCDKCGAAWTPSAEGAPSGARKPISAALAVIVLIVVILLGRLFVSQRSASGTSVVTTTSASSSTSMASSAPAPTSNGAPSAAVPAGAPAVAGPPVTPLATAAGTEAAANSKPCSLVTRAEMETILGAKIVKVTTSELTCNYFTDETMSAEVETTWTGGKAAFAQVKGFNSAPGLAAPVAGIGDEAYLQAAGVLHVLKGDTYVVVNSRVYPKELETESAIARKAIERLK